MATFVGFAVLVTALIHLYLWTRLVRDTTGPGRWRRIGGLAALLLALLVPATMAGTRNGTYWLAWPGYLWLALMFYLLVLLLVLEVPMAVAKLVLRRRAAVAEPAAAAPEPALVGAAEPSAAGSLAPPAGPVADPPAAAVDLPDHDPARRLLLARGAAIFAGLTAAGITGYGVRTAMGPPQLDRVRIPLAKLPRSMDGLRIATVSDIHLGPLRGRAHTARIVEMINRMDADLVAVVGDLVDGSVAELGEAAEPLRDLRSRYGSFFVTGNHEYYSGVEEWVREVDRLGLRVLQNERQEIRARGGVLDLAGVNDVSAAGTGLAAPADYAAALGDRDPSRPVVLLAHQPVAAHEAAKFGVDLQLSGHTHGGQMAPFNLAVKLQQPVVSGLGKVDGTTVYVTNGAGFWGPPVRVGAPPQVTLVELRAP
ncbi:metallophosphoesterase [Micromonospora sp. NBC_00898]|uniref:metallophosphoesterase n=1 Tax=Micromonospora sp. NBC_00898 TaxID=2975981 RepID=UPI003867D2F7|nr:metallophosphoesterase [Micromonospora sp. NBC_00898]